MAASLYRRHRPRTFADVVGQEHVVRTLSNAISQGRVHHAYLFVGSRGTGKTSMAKILAASLNCSNGGPTVTPCGTCESCRAIASATSLDVVEMDAASNNSVDDIRDLRERVAYAPVAGRYKVYILDEAHMLTPAAWNAFLKTLEEPPPHTIFVLATTEANKVLPTVVDRCHRFDFGRPSVSQIASVLRRVADAESIEIPDEAVALVARSATGSFRDALGTLEQLLAYSGKTIALDDVLAVLGAADADLLFGTVDAVAEGDARSALLAAARLAESGRDIGRFFGDLEAHARGLMVVQVLGDVPPELHVTPEQDQRLAEQAERVSPATVVRLLELIAAALRAMKDGADARTQLELALVKAATPALEPSVKALQTRLERLETRPKSPERPETAAGRAASPAAAAQPPAAAAQAAPTGDASPAAVQAAPSGSASPEPRGRTDVAISAQVAGQPPVAVSATLPGASADPQDAQRAADDAAAAVAQDLATEDDPNPAVTATATVEPEAPAPAPSLELSLEAFGDVWPAVVDSLREETPMLAAALDVAAPAEVGDNAVTLAWPESSAFLKRKAEDPANRDLIVKAIRSVTGSSLRLVYELRAGDVKPAAATPQLSEDDLVKRFMDEFDAEELPPEPEEQT
ncbi:MAG TPA: DNA polymerase III subunit gamma/tau [Solirubrobacter sp.]|nr:DNA polymerase III subunit gamma/tau [Solirubrobacter sp.]